MDIAFLAAIAFLGIACAGFVSLARGLKASP